MKKLLTLAILLTTYSNIFAFLTQANWRWRNDNGSQTTATWKAALNTPIVVTGVNENIRLRMEVYNNTGGNVALLDTLQYATSTAGPWTNIDTLAGPRAFMLSTNSAFVVQDEPTTTQLIGVNLLFSPGKIMVDSMVLRNISLPNQQRTEFEWVITATVNAAPNTTYYFREWGAAASNLDIGITYPSLTTAGVLPIKLTSFNAVKDGKRVKIDWSTASEQNNDRFEVQRSSDGRTWKTIANVKVKGNTTATSSYSAFDEAPLTGTNYYMISQYDKDGRSSKSPVKLVKMTRSGSIISIFPNPSKSGVNFSIDNKGAANMEATLTNVNGSIVHHEIFKNVAANSLNKLNMSHRPAPGVYILKLKSSTLSESVKIVIE